LHQLSLLLKCNPKYLSWSWGSVRCYMSWGQVSFHRWIDNIRTSAKVANTFWWGLFPVVSVLCQISFLSKFNPKYLSSWENVRCYMSWGQVSCRVQFDVSVMLWSASVCSSAYGQSHVLSSHIFHFLASLV
jgi:hypothetical protein